MKSQVACAAILAVAGCVSVARAGAQCTGDCNRDGEVSVNELVTGINIAVGNAPIAFCPASDCNASGVVTVDCLVRGVNVALGGCPLGVCGNGAIESAEECDDGNGDPFDGCTDACTICGNHTVTAPEECDDGNLENGDGCDRNCRLTACGNGVVGAGEQCDDGNTSPCDGCSAICQREGGCGDGVLDPTCEQCDDGNASDADRCRAGCVLNLCGDGVLDPAAEECDDGNFASCDGCSAGCQRESGFCGDGVLDGNCEQCDDGNTSDADGCRTDCTAGDVPGRVGPGYVSALVVDPRTPTTLYARTECGGVLKSGDGGDTWSAANRGLPPADYSAGFYAGPLAIDPVVSSTLYSGGFPGAALFRSTDASATWNALDTGLPVPSFFCSAPCGVLAVDPLMPDTLYAAGIGFPGFFRSSNRGATWTPLDAGPPGLGYASALAADPNTPGVLYAGVGDSVFRSTDGGDTWVAANTGLPRASASALAIDPMTPGTLYASTGERGGVFKSTDGGNGWMAADTGLPESTYALAVDPRTPGRLYAGTNGGVFRSTDGGGSWRRADTATPPVAAIAIDPATPTTLYAVSNRYDVGTSLAEGAVYKSTDGGETWQATGLAGNPRCGDGVRCRYEPCDDGNGIDGDGCDSNCTATACGNGVVTAGEECDDGNRRPCDGCTADCRIESGFCGDGVLYAACERCDDGNRSDADACRNDCRPNVCGDGVRNPGTEACDDGNLEDGDGCDHNCTPTACGNGVLTAGEECDDGNAAPCDGCTPACRIQLCGDGHVDADCGEQCDDGNGNPFDGCTDACTRCGDGLVTPPEDCDDDRAGCTAACTRCGDRIVTPPEQCDDGNLVDGDGCDASCTTTGCGNGVVQGDEECDDGNTIGGDGCAANCTRERVSRFALDPDQSPLVSQAEGLAIPLRLSGELTVRSGRPRGGVMDAPLVIRATDVRLEPISIGGLCLCIGAAADPVLGRDNAGTGSIACGATGLNDVDVVTSIDHNTDDSDPTCANGAVEAGTCVSIDRFGIGIGICERGTLDGRPCRGDFDCAPHRGICTGPASSTVSGSGPSGSAVMDLSLASWAFPDCSVDPADPLKGPDGIPCTTDDREPKRTLGRCGAYSPCLSLLPPHVQLRLTTGTARAEVIDANNSPGRRIASGSSCGGMNCTADATGRPFGCSLEGDPLAGDGAALAGAFPALDNLNLGDTVTTLALGLGEALAVPCVGDCDQSGAVTVAEIVTGVGGALGGTVPVDCPSLDGNGDGRLTVDELIASVDGALNGCRR